MAMRSTLPVPLEVELSAQCFLSPDFIPWPCTSQQAKCLPPSVMKKKCCNGIDLDAPLSDDFLEKFQTALDPHPLPYLFNFTIFSSSPTNT